MAMRVQSLWSQLESISFQMQQGVSPTTIAGPMALAKIQASQTFEFCARETSQIFGGSSLVREGRGQLVERWWRESRAAAIPGGSEEIMMDLAMRMAKL